jgi:hypothetical protein
LIKDLILQGDSMLDEKEMALMAQYQPHHCRQQQQQHEQRKQQQEAQNSSGNSRPQSSTSITRTTRSDQKTDTDLPQQQQLSNVIPVTDTNYLAPPTPTPRIRIHKAM